MKCSKSDTLLKFGFEFDYRVLSEKLRNKTICESETLIDQERHLALKMLTSRTAHAERQRVNTPAKQQQGKA
jgi:hypothetical protein